jgi:hypothetical protein
LSQLKLEAERKLNELKRYETQTIKQLNEIRTDIRKEILTTQTYVEEERDAAIASRENTRFSLAR